MSKPTAEQIAEAQKMQAEQIEQERKRILGDFEEIKKTLTETGYDQQSYKADAVLTVESKMIVKISALIQGIQDRFQKVNEVIETSNKYVNDMLGLAALELLDMHNDMAKIHIQACKDGNTISHTELDKEDAKVKVTERGQVIKQDTKIITDNNQ